mgnify:FL=1
MNKKVLLGMSGGVDSSVSAILLKQQGYEVIGATMRLWEAPIAKENNNLKNEVNILQDEAPEKVSDAINDAKKVCENLGIEHHVIDLRDEFKEKVINNFICTYMCAKTPNPCVECNKFMKFKAFYEFAQKLGCEYIATGHYAKIEYSEKYNQYVLKKANAQGKDQSYFLYGIDKKILPHILFPLADFEDKEDIRKIAEENGLEVARKKDSQEVCFIPDNDYIGFIKNNKEIAQSKLKNTKRLKANSPENNNSFDKVGNIVLQNGEILGKHNGLINYTVGQRKGLGISYKEPLYVLKLSKEKNEVIVGVEKDLYSLKLEANELNFLLDIDLSKEVEIEAKVRYRSLPAKAILKVENGTAKVKFLNPQRAITPGQSVVFYLNNVVLGGGKIL